MMDEALSVTQMILIGVPAAIFSAVAMWLV